MARLVYAVQRKFCVIDWQLLPVMNILVKREYTTFNFIFQWYIQNRGLFEIGGEIVRA
jgi:hypothetical protein